MFSFSCRWWSAREDQRAALCPKTLKLPGLKWLCPVRTLKVVDTASSQLGKAAKTLNPKAAGAQAALPCTQPEVVAAASSELSQAA